MLRLFFYSLSHNEWGTKYRGLTFSAKQTVCESVGIPIARDKLVCEFNYCKVGVNLPSQLYKQLTVSKAVVREILTVKRPQVKKVFDWQRV